MSDACRPDLGGSGPSLIRDDEDGRIHDDLERLLPDLRRRLHGLRPGDPGGHPDRRLVRRDRPPRPLPPHPQRGDPPAGRARPGLRAPGRRVAVVSAGYLDGWAGLGDWCPRSGPCSPPRDRAGLGFVDDTRGVGPRLKLRARRWPCSSSISAGSGSRASTSSAGDRLQPPGGHPRAARPARDALAAEPGRDDALVPRLHEHLEPDRRHGRPGLGGRPARQRHADAGGDPPRQRRRGDHWPRRWRGASRGSCSTTGTRPASSWATAAAS